MTHRDRLLAIDPAGEFTVRSLCGGSRIAVHWRCKGRSGVVEADTIDEAVAAMHDAIAAPSGRAFIGRGAFCNRDFLGGNS